MRAEATNVDSLVKVELCPECPLRDKLNMHNQIFIYLGGHSVSGAASEIYFTDKEKSVRQGLVGEGVKDGLRREEVIGAYNNCQEPARTLGKPACGALIELNTRAD